jgi:hypothetical protein
VAQGHKGRVALRFAPVAALVPGIVGLAVTAVVIFLLNGMSKEQERERAAATLPPPPGDARSAAVARRLSGLRRRANPRRGA